MTEEYHSKTNEFCRVTNIATSKMSAGLASLVTKGILTKDKKNVCTLHYKLIRYLKRVSLGLGYAIRETLK